MLRLSSISGYFMQKGSALSKAMQRQLNGIYAPPEEAMFALKII